MHSISRGWFSPFLFALSIPFLLLITAPLGQLLTSSGIEDLLQTIRDPQVLKAIGRSLGTSLIAAFLCLFLGTPLSYLLARRHFPGRRMVEGLVDLPIMIPHPVIGIAILSLAGRYHPFGRFLSDLGIQIMGSYTGIITVLTFVGLPFYVNTVKSGFEAIPVRLEKASRSLGAGMASTFSVHSSDFFALLGPTGSGKSILLEAIMGLLPVGQGAIRISGQDISGYPPESRKLGLVYQDHALFPHLTVKENLVYGVKYHHISKDIQERRFGLLVDRLKLGDLLHRSPTTLSGGEKQRTALARALMLNPRALLLDEPLSALDQMFRDDARRLLKTLHQELAIPFILVSHSFSEVLFLANKGAIIKQGRLQQCGSIGDLFERPQSTFVASFVGMSNVFSCRVSKDLAHVNGLGLYTRSGAEPGHTHLAVRPEEIRLADLEATSHENTLCGQITQLDCQGFYYRVEILVQNTVFLAYWTRHAVEEKRIQTGQEVRITFPASVVHTFAEPQPDS